MQDIEWWAKVGVWERERGRERQFFFSLTIILAGFLTNSEMEIVSGIKEFWFLPLKNGSTSHYELGHHVVIFAKMNSKVRSWLQVNSLCSSNGRRFLTKEAWEQEAIGFGSRADVTTEGVKLLETLQTSLPQTPIHNSIITTTKQLAETFAFFFKKESTSEWVIRMMVGSYIYIYSNIKIQKHE